MIYTEAKCTNLCPSCRVVQSCTKECGAARGFLVFTVENGLGVDRVVGEFNLNFGRFCSFFVCIL